MTARHTGKPPTGTAQVAMLRIPMVNPAVGSALHFNARAVFAGSPSCDEDALSVWIAGTKVYELCGVQPKWSSHTFDLSPWQGKDVNIEFVVKTGTTAAALGLFQVDDIALTGECSYGCFYTTFDEAGAINDWWKGNTPGASAWALQSEDSASGSTALGANLAPELPKGAMTTLMPADKWRWPMPIKGATLELKTKLTAAQDSCPHTQFRTRVVYQYRGIAPTDPKEAVESPFMYDVIDQCKASNGFAVHQVELGEPIRGRKFLPLFILQKAWGLNAGQGAAAVAVDDFLIRCR